MPGDEAVFVFLGFELLLFFLDGFDILLYKVLNLSRLHLHLLLLPHFHKHLIRLPRQILPRNITSIPLILIILLLRFSLLAYRGHLHVGHDFGFLGGDFAGFCGHHVGQFIGDLGHYGRL